MAAAREGVGPLSKCDADGFGDGAMMNENEANNAAAGRAAEAAQAASFSSSGGGNSSGGSGGGGSGSPFRSRGSFAGNGMESSLRGFYPCASLNVGQAIRFNFGHTPFLHPPSDGQFRAAAAGMGASGAASGGASAAAVAGGAGSAAEGASFSASSLGGGGGGGSSSRPVRAVSDAAAFSAASAALAHQALLGLGRSSVAGFTGYHISQHPSTAVESNASFMQSIVGGGGNSDLASGENSGGVSSSSEGGAGQRKIIQTPH